MKQSVNATPEIKKHSIAAMTTFATNHIPTVDASTLEKFLELVYVNGSHGSLNNKQLADLMRLMIQHVPDIHIPSLQTLADLLNVYIPITAQPSHQRNGSSQRNGSILTDVHLTPPQTFLNSLLN